MTSSVRRERSEAESKGEGHPPPDERGAPPWPCRWLRARSRYGRSIDGIPWESGLSPLESYWCLRTSAPVGPDDAPVHGSWCGAGRGCFEDPHPRSA